jgi:vanillate O-demethylase ferredoxin subunit
VGIDLFPATVARKAREAEDICVFELAHPAGSPLPGFTAGAHINVEGPTGLLRQYSLCNKPGETGRYVIGVLKDPASRGGSLALHDRVQEGDVLRISAPDNRFSLASPRGYSILLAGGIGITPLLSMAEDLSQASAPFEVRYCTRAPARTAFRNYLRRCRFASSVHFHFDDGAAEQKLDLPGLLLDAPKDAHIYVCGPTGFIGYALRAAEQLGWSGDHLHTEYFTASKAAADTASREFDVKVASTGQIIRVAKDVSIAAALFECGIEVSLSCEQGICGTCVTKILEGVPDHRDGYLTDEERARNDRMTICCSRSKSPMLVLDL